MPQPPVFAAGSSSDYVNSWGDYRWNNFYDQSVIDEPANDPLYGSSSGSQDDIGFNTSPTDPPDTTDAATDAPAEEAATEADATEAPAGGATEAPAAEGTTAARPAREFRHPPSTSLVPSSQSKNGSSLPSSPTELLQMLFDAIVSTTTQKPKARAKLAEVSVKNSSGPKFKTEGKFARSRLSAPFLLQITTPKRSRITTRKSANASSTKLPQLSVSLQNLFGTSVVGKIASRNTVDRPVREFPQTGRNDTISTFPQTGERVFGENVSGPGNSSKPGKVVWDIFQVAVARVPSPDDAGYIISPGVPVFRSLLRPNLPQPNISQGAPQFGDVSQSHDRGNILQLSLNKSESVPSGGPRTAAALPVLLSPVINYLARQTTPQSRLTDSTVTPMLVTLSTMRAGANAVVAVDPEMPLAMRRRGLCSVINGDKRRLGICVKNSTVQDDCDGMVIKVSSHCSEAGSVCCFEVDA
ncbi:hypothetical protein RvY_05922-2 [Ramazzottius varieornatus]|nr:hypothetical protein RvY_05922-2 [Ramazzottius varieornatus]